MDLAEGHIIALEALERDETFKSSSASQGQSFGGSGGKFKAYNLGKGKGMSVFEYAPFFFVEQVKFMSAHPVRPPAG